MTALGDRWRGALWRLPQALAGLALVALVVSLWPATVGGGTRFVVVRGPSMEPTFHGGDLVVARAAEYEVGDIAVFRVPAGQAGAGQLVIHRIVEINDDGTFLTQGDNRNSPDPWTLSPADAVGVPTSRLPYAGRVVTFVLSVPGLSLIIGALVTWVAWPRRDDDAPTPRPTRRRSLRRTAVASRSAATSGPAPA